LKVDQCVALVTGAASGLGRATALRLAASGARVVAVDVSGQALESLADEVPRERLMLAAASVADAPAVETVVDEAVRRFGALHIAVSCAGVADAAKTVSKGKPFPLETWDKVIAVNLTGTFNVVRFAAAAMARNAPDAGLQRGVIISTSSGAASQGQIGQAAYSASKAGVIGMTLPVARDLADLGIRAVAIAPGLFDTGMVAALPAHVTQSIVDRMVLFPRRLGRPDEFAALVQFIVENDYLNATTIDLDAGTRLTAR
jgi:NAD(P)-dependent dehydrogenase (short-subunit alcohol dehydrogenase family)